MTLKFLKNMLGISAKRKTTDTVLYGKTKHDFHSTSTIKAVCIDSCW